MATYCTLQGFDLHEVPMSYSYRESIDSLRRFMQTERVRKSVVPLTVSARLTGILVTALQFFEKGFAGRKAKRSDILFEALTLYFGTAELGGDENEKIEIVVRRTDLEGNTLREVSLGDYFDLPLLTAYRTQQEK